MKKDTHYFFLGVFVMTGVALIGGVATVLGAEALFVEYTRMETYFDESVSGLEPGSAVKFRGITVGEVVRIAPVNEVYLTERSYGLVRVKVRTRHLNLPLAGDATRTFEERVRRGLRVSLKSSSITGGSYIETEYIVDHKRFPELPIDWLPAEIYVPSTPSTLLRLQEALDSVLDNLARTDIRGVVAAARDTLREFESSMVDLDFKGLSGRAQDLMGKAGTTIATAGTDLDRLTTEIDLTLKQVRGGLGTTLTSADQTLARINGVLDRGRLGESLQQLATMLDGADATLRDVRTLVAHTGRTVDGVHQLVRGRSREVQVALGNLRQVLQNLNSLTGLLVEYPSLLFFGKPPKQPGEGR